MSFVLVLCTMRHMRRVQHDLLQHVPASLHAVVVALLQLVLYGTTRCARRDLVVFEGSSAEHGAVLDRRGRKNVEIKNRVILGTILPPKVTDFDFFALGQTAKVF